MDALRKTESALGSSMSEHVFDIYFRLASFAFNPGERSFPR